jgi:hypothetical protein
VTDYSAKIIDAVRDYLDEGFKLTALRPGSKAPYLDGWGRLDLNESHWLHARRDGVGLILSRSGIAVIDIDDLANAYAVLESIDVDLAALLSDPGGVQIVSGRENRAKLLYRIQTHQREYVDRRRQLSWRERDGSAFAVVDFRAGSDQLQDVLPPTTLDDGRTYEWRGDWRNIPPLPDELAAAWRDWPTVHELMTSIDPNRKARHEHERAPRVEYDRTEHGDVIGKFNDAFDVVDVLARPSCAEHYEPKGSRWRRKGSKEGAGVVVLPCQIRPGHRVAYSHHGGDPFFALQIVDSFALFCLVEHDGDVKSAVRAAAHELGLPPLLTDTKWEGEDEVDYEDALASFDVVDDDDEGTSLVRELKVAVEERIAPVIAISPRVQDDPDPSTVAETGKTIAARAMPTPEMQDIYDVIGSRMDGVRKPTVVLAATVAFAAHCASRTYDMHGIMCGVLDSTSLPISKARAILQGLMIDVCAHDPLASEENSITLEYASRISTRDHLSRHFSTGAKRLLFATSSMSTLLERRGAQTVSHDMMISDLIAHANGESAVYAGKERVEVARPGVTLLCDVTAAALAAMNHTAGSTGLLQSMIVFSSRHESTETSRGSRFNLSTSTLDRAIRLLTPDDRLGDPGMAEAMQRPLCRSVVWDDGAREIITHMRTRMLAEIADAPALAGSLRGCSVGWPKSAALLACAIAAWTDPDRPRVSVDAAAWSADLVLDAWRAYTYDTAATPETTGDVERVIVATVRASGARGMTAGDVRRARVECRMLGRERFKGLIDEMIDAGDLIGRKSRGGIRLWVPGSDASS